MNKIKTVVSIEVKKLFNSKIPLLTLLALAVVPIMGGFFMFVLKDPDLAQSLGLISTKAHLAGIADWSSYFELLAQAIAIGGMLVFSFVMAWVFGREYSDRTITDLLALPKSRDTIVLGKFIVTILWSMFLSVFVLFFGIIVGKLVDVPLWSSEIVKHGIFVYVICAFFTISLSTPVAFFACFGRGYLPAIGFTIFTLVLAQIIALTGYGYYFPWSIPPQIAGVTGDRSHLIEFISIIIIIATSLLGVVGTLLWWRYADHS